MNAGLRHTLALAVALGLLFAAHLFVARPWYLSWGATRAEIGERLPGDDIVSTAGSRDRVTRAVTIQAPAEKVWPWLAQLGQDRGGFYSFELLEDLVGCEMPRVEQLDPRLQQWRTGDKLWMYPERKAHGAGHAVLMVHEPGRALGFGLRQLGTPVSDAYDGSWSFVLRPVDPNTTRLIVRSDGDAARGVPEWLFTRLLMEPVHFVMERRMMEGIRQRAEGEAPSTAADVAQVALWTVTMGLLAFTGVLVFGWPRCGPTLVSFVAAGVVFQVLTFVQPPPMFGLLLVFALVVLLVIAGDLPRLRPRDGTRLGDERMQPSSAPAATP